MRKERRVETNKGKIKVKRKMTREEMEKKKKIIKISFLAVITLIVLFIIMLIASNVIVFDKNKETNLVINNRNVTQDLKNGVLIKDDVIYLSEDDVQNFFDKYIYTEEENGKIITTYDKKIAEIGFEDNVIEINGSEKEIYAHAIEENGITYLPISEMNDVYNLEMENIEESKVVTMDSLDREQKKAILNSNVSVKSSKNLIAKTIDKAKKGDSVVVISNDGKFVKVRTENGKIGYVKSKKLDSEFLVREAMEEEKQIEGKINLTWDYFSTVGSAPNRNGTTIEGVNVVSPAFFYLDENGDLQENIGKSGKNYINWAHENGYKVWPMVSNAEAGIEVTSTIMNSYEERKKLIEKIVSLCVENNLDGINVDFENMKEEDKDLYSRFIIELTPRIKEIGMVISVDVTAPDGAPAWSLCFDRHVIGDVADYIVFMAYDQYGKSSDKAGTTAGYNWVKLSLDKFLQTEEIESEKIILGIPFYTRLWTTNSDGEVISNSTVTMKNIDNVLLSDAERNWNDELKQYYVEYSDGNNKKEIWIEDIESLKAKVSLVKENNLAGIGSWEKDMESEEVWQMLAEELK